MNRFMMMVVAAGMLLTGSLSYSFAASSFTGLGFLPGCSNSEARGVSSNGLVVVGSSGSRSSKEAFRWTSATGMVGIGKLPCCVMWSEACAVSNDGSVVVGKSSRISRPEALKLWDSNMKLFALEPDNPGEAFRWTAKDGMVGLGHLPGKGKYSLASGVSKDGSVIVGQSSSDSGTQAFRWTATTGMVGLGYLSGGRYSWAKAVSDDGAVITGTSDNKDVMSRDTFRWTAAGGMVALGHPPGHDHSYAEAISKDGSIIVGCSAPRNGSCKACRWTAQGGMVSLKNSPGGSESDDVRVVASNGSVIVGYSTFKSKTKPDFTSMEAFVWDDTHGKRHLQTVLTDDYHLDLTGWELAIAMGISADGLTIVGRGYRNRHMEAWAAHLDCPLNAPAKKEQNK